jgi:hypothetical protein
MLASGELISMSEPGAQPVTATINTALVIKTRNFFISASIAMIRIDSEVLY